MCYSATINVQKFSKQTTTSLFPIQSSRRLPHYYPLPLEPPIYRIPHATLSPPHNPPNTSPHPLHPAPNRIPNPPSHQR